MSEQQAIILVHGGAGRLTDGGLSPRRAGCARAAQCGRDVLVRGGSALDAVEAAVAVLEDDPLFNAGTGSALNAPGGVEMDASIMNGEDLRAGAVAAVRGVKNPIRLARKVLEDGRHLLLVGAGASAFAETVGIPRCPEQALIVPQQRQRWEQAHGTVGAVALDLDGRVAAATSTGGSPGKLPGRVGDSALIGAGTYADAVTAVSCTGMGEAIIRVVLAKTVADLVCKGYAPEEAATRAIAYVAEKTAGEAGVIVLDRDGRFGFAHNGAHMPVAFMSHGMAEPVTAI